MVASLEDVMVALWVVVSVVWWAATKAYKT